MSFFKRIFSGKQKESLDTGLEKSRSSVFQKLSKVFTGRRRVDEDLMDELEEALITADVGVDTTMKVLDRLRKRARFEAYAEVEELYTMLREEIGGLFTEDAQGDATINEPAAGQPRVIMVVGVNHLLTEGAGTSLSAAYHLDHFRVLLTSTSLERCYCFLCHGSVYLISLWRVFLRNTGLYFFNSIRSGVFFRFLVVM